MAWGPTIGLGPGGVAQLGEHLLCKQGVVGSIPSASTRGVAAGLAVIMEKSWLLLCCACARG